MTQHAVVIAGGGPAGMTLAGELTLAGVDVAIVERRPTPELPGSRVGGLHARTIEILDQRGIAEQSSPRDRRHRLLGLPGSISTSATSLLATLTVSGCGRPISSAPSPAG
ncbi:MAG: putative aromatic compound monooxygenase YhjG [Microvirga sp.]|jgi:2-polyprenyl-6-methoxyphenol hydroxylase-like FAD-dependent oxidoreductase|nr:putative aromatic compound monooxygenase YhjG [Microvirga sp.]